jgi:hypothetical protein
MKTFFFDLRFLIGGWPVTRVGWQRAREAAPSQRAPEDWRTPRRWHEQLMFHCKHLISSQLGPFYAFLTPFLSHKDLISRRLQRNRRKISQQGASALPPAYTHGGQLKMQNSKLIETTIFFAFGAVTIGGRQKSDGGPSHSKTLAREAKVSRARKSRLRAVA